MDKEALQAITQIVDPEWHSGVPIVKAEIILESLLLLGYRKLPEGKPPLLSVKKMQAIAANVDDQGDYRYSHKEVRRILKAQIDSTMKWVKEQK